MRASGHDELTRHAGARRGTPAAYYPTRGGSMIARSPAPEKIRPGQLLLRTGGACDLDPGHLLEVFGTQRQRFVKVLRGCDRAARRQGGRSRARSKTCQERRGNSRPPITQTEGDR